MIKLVVESSADIPKNLIERFGITVVPLHFTLRDKTYKDGEITSEDICSHYDKYKELPTTSGCTPADFQEAFDKLHEEHPNADLLHLAYSAATTCSFQSAKIAAEGKDYITCIDTKYISAGQGAVVLEIAKLLEKVPDTPLTEIKKRVKELKQRVWMGCIPNELEYIAAGGRLSNAAAFCGKILNIHPIIEVIDGKLEATSKMRGRMERIIPKYLQSMIDKKDFNKEVCYLIEGPKLGDEIKNTAEEVMRKNGFKDIIWFKLGSVVTIHSGPKSFGVACLTN